MDILSTYGTDESMELEGVVHFIGGKDKNPEKDPWIRVARTGNTKYNELLLKLFEENQAVLKGKGKAAVELNEHLMIEVMARTILLGFGNLTYGGKPVTPGVAGATQLLGVKDFRKVVQAYADDAENFRTAQVEEDAGNSQPA
jgi:hypothetical protein